MLMRMLKLESKILHDNGFKVIPMLDLRFDQITNSMCILCMNEPFGGPRRYGISIINTTLLGMCL
jgi:hypothetical protein